MCNLRSGLWAYALRSFVSFVVTAHFRRFIYEVVMVSSSSQQIRPYIDSFRISSVFILPKLAFEWKYGRSS